MQKECRISPAKRWFSLEKRRFIVANSRYLRLRRAVHGRQHPLHAPDRSIFAFEMMNFALKMVSFAFKMVNSVFKSSQRTSPSLATCLSAPAVGAARVSTLTMRHLVTTRTSAAARTAVRSSTPWPSARTTVPRSGIHAVAALLSSKIRLPGRAGLLTMEIGIIVSPLTQSVQSIRLSSLGTAGSAFVATVLRARACAISSSIATSTATPGMRVQ